MSCVFGRSLEHLENPKSPEYFNLRIGSKEFFDRANLCEGERPV